MRQHLYIVGWVTALLLMVGCRHVSQVNLLAEAEAFLPAEPDSANVRLKIIDIRLLEGDEEGLAFYALLRTMTDAMQGTTSPNDTLVNLAYNYYRDKSGVGISSDHALVKHFAQSALYMGDWYAAKDSIKASEDCYRQAIKYSKKAEDWHTCYIAHSCLAEQLHWNNSKEALALIESAIDVYGKINDNLRNLVSLYEYAANYASQIAYEEDSSFQPAMDFAIRANSLVKNNLFNDYYDQINLLFAEIYWAKGDFQRALDFVRHISLDNLNSDASLTTNLKIAQYYLSCDSVLKAKELYQAPSVIYDKNLTYLYARGLAEASTHQLNKDSILFYLDSAFTASEAMFLEVLQTKDDYYHDNLEKEKKAEKLIYKDKLKTWIFVGTIIFLFVSCLLMGRLFILRFRIQLDRRRNSVMQRKYEIERNIEEKRLIECEVKLLREQQERKEEEAKHLQHEMELLKERQIALADSHQKKTAAIKHLQRYIIDRTDITMKLKGYTNHVRMTQKDWNDVERLLDEIDDQRISKIRARFKNLSTDDIRLCIMVRIGMSNPAIGNVYCITPSAVQHRKLTLKKNKFGVDHPNVTLDDFIASI